MWWIAATVTDSKMYVKLDQYASSRDLKQFMGSELVELVEI